MPQHLLVRHPGLLQGIRRHAHALLPEVPVIVDTGRQFQDIARELPLRQRRRGTAGRAAEEQTQERSYNTGKTTPWLSGRLEQAMSKFNPGRCLGTVLTLLAFGHLPTMAGTDQESVVAGKPLPPDQGSSERIARPWKEPVVEGKPLRVWLKARRKADRVLNRYHTAPGAPTALARALEDRDEDVRIEAAHWLQMCGRRAASATPALVAALKRDTSWAVRASALSALAAIAPKDPTVVSVLLHALQADPNSHVRAMAGFVLRDLKPTSAVAAAILQRAVRDRARAVRTQAAHVLATISKPEVAVPSLLAAPQGDDGTDHPFGSDVSSMAGPLGKTGLKGLPHLRKAFRHPDATTRARAVCAVSRMWIDFKETHAAIGKCVPEIIALLTDRSADIRLFAAGLLGEIGDRRAVAGLTAALADRNSDVRAEAASALGWFGKEAGAAVPALLRAVKDSHPIVRGSVACALGRLGTHTRKSVAVLAEALDDKEEYVRWCAADALGEIGPRAAAAIPALRRALKSTDRELRKRAAEALELVCPDSRQDTKVRK
jgi:HEAT repeat protein